MNPRSMTGFGRAKITAKGLTVSVEISSINRKQIEVRMDLPPFLAYMEPRLAERIRAEISRGSVTCSARLDELRGAKKAQRLDTVRAAAILRELRQAATLLRLKDDLTASALLAVPGVLKIDAACSPADAAPLLERALEQALSRHTAMRRREGRALVADMRKRLSKAEQRLARIERRAPKAAARHRHNMQIRIAKAGLAIQSSDARLMREVAIYADRCDIAEEIVRLHSHLNQAKISFKSDEPIGRSLDFLLQEMFREINTIGSKANDAAIAHEVVAIKTEFERVREQVQNIE